MSVNTSVPKPEPDTTARETGALARAAQLVFERVEREGDFDPRRLLAAGPVRAETVARELERCGDLLARPRRMPRSSVLDFAGAGGVVLAKTPDGWLVAHGRAAWLVTPAAERSVTLSGYQLDRLGLGDELEVVIVEARLGLEPLAGSAATPKRPWARLGNLVRLEASDVRAIAAYAVVLGGLSLAVPVAVQVLVNTIALGSLLQPLVILSALLFGTLLLAGALQLLQWYATEVLQRKLFVRVAEDFARRLPTVRYAAQAQLDLRELVNRFFEAPNLQKTAGTLLLDGLSLALQTVTGMLLLTFYHPALLAFALVLVAGLVLVVALGHGSVASAIAESKAKYRLAAWLENVAERPTLFHRQEAAMLATITADRLTRDYLRKRKQHYARVFRQLSAGVAVQIVAMVALLGLGGYLVIEGQLTLGQLVAAELVVGRVAGGFAKLGKHFEGFYDLMASLDKVGSVLDLPKAPPPLSPQFEHSRAILDGIVVGSGNNPCSALQAECIPGRHIWVTGGDGGQRDELLEVIGGLREPLAGNVVMVDVDSAARTTRREEREAHSLLLRAGELVDGTVAENLRLFAPMASDGALRSALLAVGLDQVVDELPHGIDTPLLMSGVPLTRHQAARLCLARLHLIRPTLVALDGIIDDADYSPEEKERVLDWVLGPDAPWTAFVNSRDPNLERRCATTLLLARHEVAA